jgi:hypothetical protein
MIQAVAQKHQSEKVSVGWGARVLPPVAAFIMARVVLHWAARTAGYKSSLTATWHRWDSAHYLSIADHGYEFFSCARLPGYNPADYCGNAAWLPGYPLLVRVVSSLGLNPERSGVLIAAAFALLSLVLLWNAFLGPRPTTQGLLGLAACSLFFGHVYYYAIFPISMCTFFQVAAIYLFTTKRYLAAGIAGGVAAFTYSSAFFLAGIFGLHLLLFRREEAFRQRVYALVASAGLTFSGFVLALALQRWEVGTWDAYRLTQAKYHYAFTLPWKPVKSHLLAALKHRDPMGIQATLVLASVVSAVVVSLRAPRRSADLLLALFAVVYLLVPLMLGPGYVAVVRSESMLLPMMPLAAKLPVPVLVCLVGLLLFCSLQISPLFFLSRLV